MDKILVINSGSSSIKCSLFGFSGGDVSGAETLAEAAVERIGEAASKVSMKTSQKDIEETCDAPDHASALDDILNMLVEDTDVLGSLQEVSAVGHRVVHGGEKISESVAVDDEVIEAIEENISLAPLHNPPNLTGLNAARGKLPDCLQVAVFDTAFHQSMPPQAFLYALPYDLYTGDHIRRYGFHGTSHRYVAERAAGMLGKPLSECNLITLHLGNGCSATAVKDGQSVDTSMGLTPLEGLVMGTRCGDIDPSLPHLLTETLDMTSEATYELLNKKSGLLGLSGVGNDMREVIDASRGDGDTGDRALKALQVFCYKIRKYIGAYMAVLGRVDGIVFTAGIGENCAEVRRRSLDGLENLGIRLDEEKNEDAGGGEYLISSSESEINVMIIPTNEALKIAMDTYQIFKNKAM